MAHLEQQELIKKLKEMYPSYFYNKKILEVGSLNINGSVRTFFDSCDYLGIDVASGKDVDLVVQGQDYAAPSETYDVAISCECFEHNPYWAETFANMHRLVKFGGLIIVTCATTGRKEHGTTATTPDDSPLTINIGWNDYYRNLTKEDFELAFDLNKMFSTYNIEIDNRNYDLYFYGIK